MSQILEPGGNLGGIWPDPSLYAGERAEAWETEVTSARGSQRSGRADTKGCCFRILVLSSALWHTHCLSGGNGAVFSHF